MSDSIALRIIDANHNRAREALRVIEEYARFGLNDAGLTQALKELRHALVREVTGLMRHAGTVADTRVTDDAATAEDALLAQRDIIGDVGRDARTGSEYQRDGVLDVVRAATKRLAEALRSIEEYGKTVDSEAAARIEQLRYRAYELERRVLLSTRARQRFGLARLYVLITEALCKDDWLATAKAALAGGADVLQLREKDLSDRELLDRATQLATLCHDHDALCIINDRPDIAVLSGADGVHLGQEDMSVAEARRMLPPHALVGVSTHTIEQVRTAAEACPDYIAVGPMFATSTKPQDDIPGPALLTLAGDATSLPLVAIGGINERNAREVVAAAECCLCVCSAVIAQDDVLAATRAMRRCTGE